MDLESSKSLHFDLFSNAEWTSEFTETTDTYWREDSTTSGRTNSRIFVSVSSTDLSWFVDILAGREGTTLKRDMVDLIGGTRKLVYSEQYYLLSKLVADVVVRNDVATELIVAALRSSFAARRKIPRWRKIVSLAKSEIARRGRDPEELLQGLESR